MRNSWHSSNTTGTPIQRRLSASFPAHGYHPHSVEQGWLELRPVLRGLAPILAGMAFALAAFDSGTLPLVVRIGALGLFAILAFLQPLAGLLFVPLTVPLYLIPAAISGLRSVETLVPLHEVALIASLPGCAIRWWRLGRPIARVDVRPWLPYALFVVAGLWGVVIALPQARDEAIREFRWLVFEPLLWYLLLRWCAGLLPYARMLAILALLAAGLIVALLGVAQFAGLDLVPLLGDKRSFSDNVIIAGGVRRVASVYGHPNNLGLFLGRVWPLAAVLALGVWRGGLAFPRWFAWLMVALTCVLLAGIVVTFSRGAWIGALVAGGILALGILGPHRGQGRALLWLAGVGLLAAALLAIGLSVRSEGGSANVRVLLWQEALGYLRLHPLGIGLDQFLAYHHPESGMSLIDPSLVGTSEMYAAHPHNVLLDIWLRMGPLGLFVFAWLLLQFVSGALGFVRGSHAEPIALGALAAMAAALTHGLVDHFYFVPDLAFSFWLLLSLVKLGRHRGRAGIDPATKQVP